MSQPAIPTLDINDSAFDSLFPDPAPVSLSQPQATPVAAEPQPTAPSPTPQAPTADDYLRGSASVYKTREAAEKGINEKDALIQELRQQYSLATGIDPITKRPLSQTTQTPDSYAANPQKYIDDLKKANTPETLAAVQSKFVLDTLAPVAPAISGIAKNQATRQLEEQLPDFKDFYGSASYQQTLDANPTLREAIQAAEADVRFAPRLAELYKLTYLADKGIKLPELLKRQTSQSQTTARPTTLSPTTPTPEATAPSTPATLNSSEGRKRIIAEFEARQGAKVLSWP